MKNAIITITFLTLMSCGINSNNEILDDTTFVKLGTVSSIPKDETVIYENNIKVKVVEILESRCPINAVCIWEGEAKVTFQIGNEMFSLLREESKEFSFVGSKYKLEFKDITPFPTTENEKEIKKAVFTVSQSI